MTPRDKATGNPYFTYDRFPLSSDVTFFEWDEGPKQPLPRPVEKKPEPTPLHIIYDGLPLPPGNTEVSFFRYDDGSDLPFHPKPKKNQQEK